MKSLVIFVLTCLAFAASDDAVAKLVKQLQDDKAETRSSGRQ